MVEWISIDWKAFKSGQQPTWHQFSGFLLESLGIGETEQSVLFSPKASTEAFMLDIKQLYANLQELTREMNNNFIKCLSIDILTANILQCALIIYFIYRFDPSDRSKLKSQFKKKNCISKLYLPNVSSIIHFSTSYAEWPFSNPS